jgi:peptidoglycan-associated lipoprotein
MRRLNVLLLLASVAALAACPSPPKNGECKTSADCATQEGFGKVCVAGRCAECAADADCKAGFTCAANRCEPKPAAAPPPRAEPKPECTGDAGCGAGQSCQAGRCVAAAVDPACADAAAFTVRFGFDQAAIGADASGTLKKLAACLQKSPPRRLGVDGHCDDRGTTAYNMALGKKRSEAVKKYLADLGAATAVDTNTFGKEKPLCREATEDCWARNRRAELRFER